MTQVGNNIKTLRQSLNLTQAEFAKKMGISRSYLGDLENNRRNPSIATIMKLSKKTGISSSFLINGVATFGDEFVLGRDYFKNLPPRFTEDQMEYIDTLMEEEVSKTLLLLQEVNLENYDRFDIVHLSNTLKLIEIERNENEPVNIRKIAQLALVLESNILSIIKSIDSDKSESIREIKEHFDIYEQLTELLEDLT